MFKLVMKREIAISHTLKNHKGKCSNDHGHNLLIKVEIESNSLIESGSSEGMIMDFGDVKSIIDELDHTNLNNYFTHKHSCNLSERVMFEEMAVQPTAERLAKYLAKEIKGCSNNIVTVQVWETSNQYAEYKE